MKLRKTIENPKTVTYVLPKDLVMRFQRLYPRLGTVFIRRCLLRACADKVFFDKVYFGTVDEWSDLGANHPDFAKYASNEDL